MPEKEYERDWENVNSCLQRLRLANGFWLLRSYTTLIIGNREVYASEALQLYSDPNYNWKLKAK